MQVLYFDGGTEVELKENVDYGDLSIHSIIEGDRRYRENRNAFEGAGYSVVDEGKYIYLNEANPMGRELTYEKNYYYEQIPGGEINKNPNLRRNDGY